MHPHFPCDRHATGHIWGEEHDSTFTISRRRIRRYASVAGKDPTAGTFHFHSDLVMDEYKVYFVC